MRPVTSILQSWYQRFSDWLDADIPYLASGTIWIGVSQGVGMAIALATAYVFANFLPQDAYGIYKYVLAVAAILAIPAIDGMNTAITQAVARGDDGTARAGFRTRIRWGFLGTLGGIALGAYYLYHANAVLGYAFIAFGIATPFIEGFTAAQAILGGKKRFDAVARQTIMNSCVSAILVIAAVLLTHNALIVILAYITGGLIGRGISYIISLRYLENNRISSSSLSFGLHVSIASILGVIAGNIDVLSLWHGADTHSLALYAFALSIVTPFRTFVKTVFNLAQPKFASQNGQDLILTVPRRFRQAILLLIPVTLSIMLVIPIVFRFLFPTYIAAVPFAEVMAALVVLYPTKLYGIAIMAREHKKALYATNTINSLFGIGITILLVIYFGPWGAVVAGGLQQIFSFAITYLTFRRIVRH